MSRLERAWSDAGPEAQRAFCHAYRPLLLSLLREVITVDFVAPPRQTRPEAEPMLAKVMYVGGREDEADPAPQG
jgi:hypothetical protein